MTQRSESDGSAGSPPPRRRRLRLKIGAILIALVVLGSFFDYLGRVRQAILPWTYPEIIPDLQAKLRWRAAARSGD
jgi:hypothetical protein